jgi:hypothetical protein
MTGGWAGRSREDVDSPLFALAVCVIVAPRFLMALRFPSLAFFEALQREMRAERERFARLGFFDTTFGIRVLPEGPGAAAEFVLGFEVFDCVRVAEGLAGVETDFVAEGSFSAWREMLDNIHALGAADTAHSFNTLTHFGEQLSLRYDDPDLHDKAYRFAESIQEFLDLSARLDFDYPDGSRTPARRQLRRTAT